MVVKCAVFSSLNGSASHRCDFEPHLGHMQDKLGSAKSGVFSCFVFSPHLMLDSAQDE